MQGDPLAFGELFNTYYPLLFQYGRKICPDTATLEDNIQELFTEIWQKKPSQPVLSVKAYLLQSLKYKLYKSFRNQKHNSDVEGTDNEPFELSHENFLVSSEEQRNKLARVLETINKLPTRQREIIYLKLYKGLSYEEVSQVMDINYQVVRNLLCQALKTFRKLMLFI